MINHEPVNIGEITRWNILTERDVLGAQFVRPDKLQAVLTDLITAGDEAAKLAIGQDPK